MAVLNNKIAIVTGAGSGFGEGIATAYINEGAKVVVADINEAAALRVASALGQHASAFTVDVSSGEQVRALVTHCANTFGPPDIVVNNARSEERRVGKECRSRGVAQRVRKN